jgi:hypothetical protein
MPEFRWPRVAAMLMIATSIMTLQVKASGDASKDSLLIGRAFFALSVGDVDKMALWYCDNLGFHVDRKDDGSGVAKQFAILSRPGALIEMVHFTSAKSRTGWGLSNVDTHEIHGIFKLGFDISNLDGMFARAQKAGLEIFFPIVQARDVPRRTFGLKDPEGNIIQFFGQ